MFQVDDYVVYGGNGVCRVVDVGTVNMDGISRDRLFYTLEPVYSKSSVVYTPVDNQKVIIRRILSRNEADELIEDIPNIQVIQADSDKRREEIFKEFLKKYDCRCWVQIIKTLYRRNEDRLAQGKKITGTDERYLHTAEEGLYSELAIPLEIPKDEVEDFIRIRLDSMLEYVD